MRLPNVEETEIHPQRRGLLSRKAEAAMQNVLILAPPGQGTPGASLVRPLAAAGYDVARSAMEDRGADAADALERAFAGRPPDVLLADLSAAPDCLPLRHLRRVLRQTWGDDFTPPPTLALLQPRHLGQPDWPALADDFLIPPYSPDEALARMSLLLFRRRHVRDNDTLRFADVLIDLSSRLAHAVGGDAVLPLTPREFELLRFLVTHRGKFFARDRLLDLVWGVHFEGGERTVDIHVRRLRAKLPPQTANLLETRRGVGYGLRVPG